jgi:hypothetical protein
MREPKLEIATVLKQQNFPTIPTLLHVAVTHATRNSH